MQSINLFATSLSAQRLHGLNQQNLTSSMEKLATGQRINRGADNPAGLITSENLRSVLAALDAESRNLQRTSNVVDTADAALGEMSNLLVEANGLVVSAANSSFMSDEEQEAIQYQLDSTISAIDRLATATSFNGDNLLDGTASLTANGETLNIENLSGSNLGQVEIDGTDYSLRDVLSGGDLSPINGDVSGAQQAISAAQSQVSRQRGSLGAFQKNTIDSRLSSLSVEFESTSRAESLIRDTNYAQETSNLTRLRILDQSSLMALTQINHTAGSILNILG